MGVTGWDVRDAIGYIRVPVLFIQGEDDPYGSVAQADAVVEECYAPVDVALLKECGHSPHIENPDATLDLVDDFVTRLTRIEAGPTPPAPDVGTFASS